MSDFTPTNAQVYERIQRRAREEGKKVTRLPSKYGGVDIFVHPPGVKINAKNRDRYFVAWFMEL